MKLRARIPLNEVFFPSGSFTQPNARRWDGLACLSQTNEGINVLFRNQCSSPTAHITIPVFPDGRDSMQSVVNHDKLEVEGIQPQQGLDHHFSTKHSVEILEIRSCGNIAAG